MKCTEIGKNISSSISGIISLLLISAEITISLDKETVKQDYKCDDLADLDYLHPNLDQDLLNIFNSDSEESDSDGKFSHSIHYLLSKNRVKG